MRKLLLALPLLLLALAYFYLKPSKHPKTIVKEIEAKCIDNYILITSKGYEGKIYVYDVDSGKLVCSLNLIVEDVCKVNLNNETKAFKIVYGNKTKIVICRPEKRTLVKEENKTCFENEIELPAVTGEGKGKLVKVLVKVCNGSGKIFLNVGPKFGLDLQETISRAIHVVKNVLGVNISKYDIYIDFLEKKETILEGGSLGAAITSAIYLTILNKTFPNVCITGAIDEDGNIEKVGGIFEKAEACKGKELFIIPKENEISYKMKCKKEEKKLPGFVWIYEECYPVKMNVTEEIEKEFGLKVVTVFRIEELIRILSNIKS